MKRLLWVIALLVPATAFAQSQKLQGYIMNAGAFGKIRSFCVDTHNLPADQVEVIDHFVSE